MHVLVVTQYYRPEPGATQNRMGAFVDGLADRGHQVSVIAEQPCHPAGVYQEGWGNVPLRVERSGPVTTRRVWVVTSPRKTTARRLAFYGSFAAAAAALVAVTSDADVCLITSPPFPGALAAAVAAHARRIPFVLDVRDIWPAAAEALGELSNRRLLAALERAERWLYRTSGAVTATTASFCRHIDTLAGRPAAVHLPNGALDSLVARPWAPMPASPPFTCGFAGNLGIAQGLGIVLDAAARMRGEGIRFRLIGDGPVRSWLQAECRRRSLDGDVELCPPVPVDRIGDELERCHALLVPLRDHGMLGGFIPSKLYDAMAVGRPALVAAEGEAAELTRQVGCGLVVPPEDSEALADALRELASDPQRWEALARAGKQASISLGRSRQIERLDGLLEAVAAGRGVVGAAVIDG